MRILAVLALWCACGRTEVTRDLPALDSGTTDAGRADAGSLDAGRRDAGTPTEPEPPTSCTNRPGPDGGMRCSARVRLLELRPSSPTCFVDVHVTLGETGTLEWECAGPTGRAAITFPRASFTGVVDGDLVDTCFGSEFDYTDGCRWTSAQAIRGARSSGRLTLTYGEAPRPIERACAQPCSATGTLELLP